MCEERNSAPASQAPFATADWHSRLVARVQELVAEREKYKRLVGELLAELKPAKAQHVENLLDKYEHNLPGLYAELFQRCKANRKQRAQEQKSDATGSTSELTLTQQMQRSAKQRKPRQEKGAMPFAFETPIVGTGSGSEVVKVVRIDQDSYEVTTKDGCREIIKENYLVQLPQGEARLATLQTKELMAEKKKTTIAKEGAAEANGSTSSSIADADGEVKVGTAAENAKQLDVHDIDDDAVTAEDPRSDGEVRLGIAPEKAKLFQKQSWADISLSEDDTPQPIATSSNTESWPVAQILDGSNPQDNRAKERANAEDKKHWNWEGEMEYTWRNEKSNRCGKGWRAKYPTGTRGKPPERGDAKRTARRKRAREKKAASQREVAQEPDSLL